MKQHKKETAKKDGKSKLNANRAFFANCLRRTNHEISHICIFPIFLLLGYSSATVIDKSSEGRKMTTGVSIA